MKDQDSITLPARLRTLVLILSITAACVVRAPAATIITILSSDAAPYTQAQQALDSSLSPQGHTVRAVALSDMIKSNTLKTSDIVVAIGSEAAVWARDNAPPSSIVYYCMVPNAQGLGLDSASRVCRGIVTDIPLAKQIGLISQTLPAARTIGMLYRSDLERGKAGKAELEDALPPGWKLEAVAVNEFESKSKAIEALLARSVDIIWTSPDTDVYDISVLKALLLAALRKSVPVYGFSQAIVKSGGLVGSNINASSQGENLGRIIKNDLDATKKQGMPSLESHAQDPDHEIVVNAIVAEKLSVSLPKSILTSAAQVFKKD